MTSAELADRLDAGKSGIGYHVRQLKADGVVVFLGAGPASKVALAGSPAKEAP